jgi:hypothetical protein
MTLRRSVWLCGLAAALAAAPARAGEVDKYLPEDTEVLVSVNVRQIVDSDLFKKYALEQARAALKDQEDVQDVLKELGLDPFKDLDRVLVAKPSGGEQDRGLVIAYGRFDLDRLRAKADEAAKNQPDLVKIHKIPDGAGGKAVVYEVNVPNQPTPVFVALPNKETVLASTGKDYVVDALKKETAKEKPALKNKDFQALLEKMDAKQAVSLAGVGSALTEGGLDEVKALFEKVEAVGGGVSIGDDIKIEVSVAAKSADDAKGLKETIGDDLKQARLLLTALTLVQSDPGLELLLDVANSVRVSVKGKAVVVKASVSADALEEALKKDKNP